MLTALVATTVIALWWSLEGTYRRLHRPPPSDDRDQRSAYVWDIARALADTFAAEYAEYAHETKRLVPWVY